MAAQPPPPNSDEVTVTELLKIPEIQEVLKPAFSSGDASPTNADVREKESPDGFDAEMQEHRDDEAQGITELVTQPILRSMYVILLLCLD